MQLVSPSPPNPPSPTDPPGEGGPLGGEGHNYRLLWIVLAVAVIVVGAILLVRLRPEGDEFERLMTRGAGYLERGDATNAVALYLQAVTAVPENLDARLNLANAYLLDGEDQKVIE